MYSLTFDDLRAIVTAGGGLDISAHSWTAEQLQTLATAAVGSGKRPRLVFRGLSDLTSDQLRAIASAGGGLVVFSDK
jgi:hypothetical protein